MEKEFITTAYLQEQTGMSADICQKIIRQIKSVSDKLGIKGMVTRYDYERFLKEGKDDESITQ